MSRKVKLCTISLLVDPKVKSKPKDNVKIMTEQLVSTIKKAGKEQPDLIVCPEEFAYLKLSAKDRFKYAEKVPDSNGYIQSQISKCAKEIGTNIVYGISEKDNDKRYNTAVLVNSKGEFAGKYRKTHLVPGEDSYTTAGDKYEVFKVDNFKVGITLCMDIHYPEIWTILALKGADVIAHPTGWMDYTGDLCESLVNARAIDNQYYVITSHFIEMPYLSGKLPGHSRIVDTYGRTRADTSHIPGYGICEVDLDQGFEYWASGDMKTKYPTLKECFLGRRRPDTYGKICEKDKKEWKIENPVIHKGK